MRFTSIFAGIALSSVAVAQSTSTIQSTSTTTVTARSTITLHRSAESTSTSSSSSESKASIATIVPHLSATPLYPTASTLTHHASGTAPSGTGAMPTEPAPFKGAAVPTAVSGSSYIALLAAIGVIAII